MRIRHAVDQSSVSENVARLHAALLQDGRAASQVVGQVAAAPIDSLPEMDARNRSLRIAIDALRSDVDRLGRQLREIAALIPTSSPQTADRGESMSLARDYEQLLRRAALPIGPDYLVRTSEGYLLTPAEDVGLLVAMFETGGCLEAGTTSVVTALIDVEDWVIDVGAHIGALTLPMARRVGPSGKVIAVEPASRVRALLERSIALNGLSEQVVFHACAAGAEEGIGSLNVGPISGHSSLLPLESADHTEEVRVRRLDDLVPIGQRIRLVKIDAEGHELEIWRGMRRIVAQNPDLAVVVEFGPSHLARAGVTIDEWVDEFLTMGFSAYEINEADGQLRPLRSPKDLQQVYSTNLLLLRQPPENYRSLCFS